MSYFKQKHSDFFEYFKHYMQHQKEWATCYRLGTAANTNMFVESFHRLLKVVYLDNKQNRHVDFFLFTLIKLANIWFLNNYTRWRKETHPQEV